MSDLPEKLISSKKPLDQAILIDRKAFLSALELTSSVVQLMMDEFEGFRAAKNRMPKEIRQNLMHFAQGHINNVTVIMQAFQDCIHDPADPDGTKGKSLN